MNLIEDDPLNLNLPSYTFHEIRQLERMTQDVLEHYKKILQEWTSDGPAHLRQAVEMSLEQAEKDMKEIQAEIEVRKAKNESDAPPPRPSTPPDDDDDDKNEESDTRQLHSENSNAGTPQ